MSRLSCRLRGPGSVLFRRRCRGAAAPTARSTSGGGASTAPRDPAPDSRTTACPGSGKHPCSLRPARKRQKHCLSSGSKPGFSCEQQACRHQLDFDDEVSDLVYPGATLECAILKKERNWVLRALQFRFHSQANRTPVFAWAHGRVN